MASRHGRAASYLLAVLLTILLPCRAAPAHAQQPPDMFRDVPMDHWAYPAAELLLQKGVLIGYPDGYFRGKRTLTRYEFAVALDRALKVMLTPPPESGWGGPMGPAGPRGPRGPAGPPYDGPDELASFRRLLGEFRDELASLGVNVAAVNRRLDTLAREEADLNARLDAQPRIYGGAGVFVRADQRHGTYVDRDGRVNGLAGPGSTIGSDYGNPAVVHDLELGITAKLGGGATLDAALTSNNYVDFLGGSLSQVRPIAANAPADTYVHYLELTEPLGRSGVRAAATLTAGRYRERVSHLTLWRPNLDSYFDNPFENDGYYYLDGARIRGGVGSVQLEVFGGKSASVTDLQGNAWNMPLAGVAAGPAGTALYVNGVKPFGQPALGQMGVDQLVGADADLHVGAFSGGHVRLAAVDSMNTTRAPAGNGFDNVLALGVDGDIRIASRYFLAADWGKTITGNTLWRTVNASKNNAFDARGFWASHGWSLCAGYRYIDPRFYSPGDWGRLGNWIDPTNIQGPNVQAGWEIAKWVGVGFREEFYRVAHDEARAGGLGFSDAFNRIMVHIHVHPARSVTVTGDWEGIRYRIIGTHSGIPNVGTAQVHNPENYTRVSFDYRLTTTTLLRLSYNIGEFQGKHSIFMGPNTEQNFNILTGQVVVSF